jgi:hypothetical protein
MSGRPGTEVAMEERASEQLRALAQVDDLLARAGIAYWLFGGWAVDFHAAAVTRPHDDVDIAVWLDDLEEIARLLEEHDWRHAPAEDEDGGTGYERRGVRLELTYLVRETAGTIFTPLQQGRASWPEEAFGDEMRELQGVRARLVSLEWLTAAKSSPRDEPEDAAKDRADHAALSETHRSRGDRS